MFNIEFISDDPEIDDDGLVTLKGQIITGDESELFRSALGLWSREDYERQWREAAQRLLDGHERSAFMTSAFQFWCTMWQVDDAIRVHHEYLVPERLESLGDALDQTRTPYELIRAYVSETEDGETISEWLTTLADIRSFVQRL